MDQLGTTLRDFRKRARLTGQQLASSASLSQPKISKIERGKVMPSPEDIEKIARALKLPSDIRSELVENASELAEYYRPWRAVHREGLVGAQREVQFTERMATQIRYFQAIVIPGLLQYRQYAREIMRRANISGKLDLDEAVNVRMERQDLLHDGEREFRFVMLESALHTRYCSPEIMRVQLDLLLSEARLPNVSLGIVPSSTELPCLVSTGFGIFDDSTIIIEMLHGETVLHDSENVSLYLDTFDTLEKSAAFDDEALEVIDRVRASLR